MASILLLILLLGVSMQAVAGATAKGYATDDNELVPGMVVALSSSSTPDTPKVERAALDKEPKVIGVTTTPSDELVTIASSRDTVYVQNTGEASVFVSDLNGEIKNGDLLAPSPLLGILMKADESTAPIIGIALEDFNLDNAEDKSVNSQNGVSNVKIGKVKINLDHKAASNQQASATDSSLERLGRAVVGKDVGEIQVLAALTIFLVVLVAEGGIIYGAVSSAITAVGRNPMAKKIIQIEMLRVVFVAMVVLGVGVAAIYLILWL